jgi:hypothetical protein
MILIRLGGEDAIFTTDEVIATQRRFHENRLLVLKTIISIQLLRHLFICLWLSPKSSGSALWNTLAQLCGRMEHLGRMKLWI